MSKKESEQLSQLGNMDQIRELLFGSQVRVFEEEVAKLDSSIKTMHSELSERIEGLERMFREEQGSAVQILEQKIKNLTLTVQDESSDFKDQLVKHEKKFNRTLDGVKEETETQLNTLKSEQNYTKTTMKKELETLRSSLDTILNEQIENLGELKVSKDDFSAMLLDMAMKIKGTDLQNSLENMLQEQSASE